MSNTPLNADDELLKKIDKIMPRCGEDNCYTCNSRHKRVLKLIKADRKKHELDAKKAGMVEMVGLLKIEGSALTDEQMEVVRREITKEQL